uniref:Uncharacterized protein n=1 Tax=Anguilla anguilla TaxID=7936 RepID=A0A0E9REA5_ANGAN
MFTLLQTTCTHHWADCLRFKPSLKIHTFQSSENRIKCLRFEGSLFMGKLTSAHIL